MLKYILLLVFSSLILGCNEVKQKADRFEQRHDPFDELKNENLGRSTWQKPNLVIDKLGDLSNKVVADIGAGTGYFTFRLAFKAKRVIATDISKNMIDLIESFRLNLPQEIQNKIETRLVSADDAMLKDGECDIAVIINTVAYIGHLEKYLKRLKQQLNKNGKVVIVDFKTRNIPEELPYSADKKIPGKEVIAALQNAGYTAIEYDENTLEYQYIIIGQ